MVAYIRNKTTGKFAGSVGSGKTRIPTSSTGRPNQQFSVQKEDPQVTRIRRLAKSNLPIDRRNAARSLLCPPEVLHDLVWDTNQDYAWACIEAVKNPNLSEDDMDLVVDMYFEPALKNPALPSKILDRMGRQWWSAGNTINSPTVRMQTVLKHPNIPREWLEKALSSTNQNYRVAAASNPNLPTDLATKIITGPYNSSKVKSALARNTAISEEVRLGLLDTHDTRVLGVLAKHLTGKNRQTVVDRLARFDQRPLATNTVAQLSSDEAQLKELIYTGSSKIRKLAANNPSTAEEDKVAAALLG